MVDDETQDSSAELLFHSRLVPDGREGNKVFARSLRPGEEDTGQGVHICAGEQLIIRADGLVINSDEIDALSPKGVRRICSCGEYGLDLVQNSGRTGGVFCLPLCSGA